MLWRKEHFPRRTLGGTQHLYAPLQRAHLSVLEASWDLSLQELEDRLGLKPGLVFKQLLLSYDDGLSQAGMSQGIEN
jgi:hypothetical protein